MPGSVLQGAQSAERLPEGDDTYLLRLCLDLKLNALLLSLGAAATDPRCAHLLAPTADTDPDPEPGPGSAAAGPTVGSHSGSQNGSQNGRSAVPTPPTRIDLTTSPASNAPSAVDGVEPAPLPWERWLREDVDTVHALACELLTWGGTLPSTMGNGHLAPTALAVIDRLEAFHTQLRGLLGEVEALRRSNARPAVPPGVTSASSAHMQAVARNCRRRMTELEMARIELAEAVAAEAGEAPSGHPGELLG